MKKRKLLGGFNRFRLILTLGVAVLLPAAALIVVNFYQLKTFGRDKVLEAAFHRDFNEYLLITEKTIAKKAMSIIEEARNSFPSPYGSINEREKALDAFLISNPHLVHAFICDEKGIVFRTQPTALSDPLVRKEHEHFSEMFRAWLGMDFRKRVAEMHKKTRPFGFSYDTAKRAEGQLYISTAFYTLPNVPKDSGYLGGVTLDPRYLKDTLFPGMLKEVIEARSRDQSGKQIAMIIYTTDYDGKGEIKPLAMTAGWEGKPEVSRRFEQVFGGLTMGIRYQGTSIKEIGATWIRRNLIIVGILSALIVIGLVLTKHVVSKEMALAKLKSDFVSNVSHELRTPLALIRLYAETLELGRITTKEKKHDYYKIIRKESERLSGLINNILDFSRIEAGAKEYEFRETDIADLVRNTLDSYRYQIEQQGFTLKEEIDPSVPTVYVDREAMARALLNLVNNALKYSPDEKFLHVKLYRENGTVKLEVEDRGIGITRREQSKIFEKFYRTGDPLVHNTKGSGLGLSLVRHITDAHGGNVTVESTPGKGSKFTLSLPLNGRQKPNRQEGRSNGIS